MTLALSPFTMTRFRIEGGSAVRGVISRLYEGNGGNPRVGMWFE